METLLRGSDGTIKAVFNLKDIRLRGASRGEERLHALPVAGQYWEAAGQIENPADRYFDMLTTCPVGNRLLIDAILGQGQPDATFYDGWKVQQVIDAALEAGRRRAWITPA